MLSKKNYQLTFLIFLATILTSCNLPTSNQSDSPSQGDRIAISASSTSAPPQSNATQSPSTTSDPSSNIKDAATFGGDVTIPDYTPIEAGQSFTKIWRLQNSGDSTWTTGYSLVFDQGDHMGGPDSISLPQDVPPDGLVDISVDLIAPDNPGTYSGYWVLTNADGDPFTTPDDDEFAVFVIIRVVAAGSDTTGGATLENGVTLTGATLSASNANYSGACPIDLDFSGVINSSGTGALVYTLLPTSQTSGFVWSLPGSFTVNYNAVGSHTLDIFFNLTISSSVKGSAYVQVTGANILASNTVNFNITCGG